MPGDQVDVPFVGKQRKEYLVAGGAVAVAYFGYKWWKNRSAPASSNTAGGSNALGTFAGYDATGQPVYTNAAGQTVDANGNPDTVTTPAGTLGASGYTNPAPAGATGLPQSGSAPSTDEQWTAAVENDLQGIGYDPQAVATAIAQYLAGQALTSDQVTIIRTAWAYEGRPPEHPSLGILQSQSPPPTTGQGPVTQPAPTPTSPSPAPSPPPASPSYTSVTVTRFANPAPWNSTMWGIAQHYGYGSGSSNYLPIWNDSKNAALKAKRGAPESIEPGDVVWVIPK